MQNRELVATLLENDQSVEWVSQFFIEEYHENIYCINSPNEPTTYLSSSRTNWVLLYSRMESGEAWWRQEQRRPIVTRIG
jgi:hypothetical protein